jgi:hypothetical protein
VDKKEREQQKALAEKVAILSDSDIAEVQTAVEKIVSQGQRTTGSKQPESHSETNREKSKEKFLCQV